VKALEGLAKLPLRIAVWVVLLPFRALWGTLKTILALLGEETRRWFGLTVWGLMLWPVAQASARWYRPLLPWVLLAVLVWLWACVRAVRLTLANRLVAVRGRAAFRKLDKTASEVGGKLKDARVVMLDGGADMLKALLADPETDAQREQKRIAAAANTAVREYLDPLLFAERSAGPPNPFRRLRRARARRSEDEG
jgi:hypothetical protein